VGSTAYNAANHQTTFADKTLTYDNNGNLQTITDPSGATTYTWNARNQLVGISGPGVNASFVYDGLGRREAKTINGNLTEFLYDGLNAVQESSGATILANVLPGPEIDKFLTRTDVQTGSMSTLLTDAAGNTVALADSSGVVQTENTYEPFGNTEVSGAVNTNPFQYTSRENDNTGLYYYRTRYYQPFGSRFLSEDSIMIAPPGENLYTYVFNNPIIFIDPLGLRGFAFGGSFQFTATGFLGKAYGFGGGFYYNPDTGECGYYTSRVVSGEGVYLGAGLQGTGFSGARPGGYSNITTIGVGATFSFGRDNSGHFDSGSYSPQGFGIGGGASDTYEHTVPYPFPISCGKCPL
jgi:RHS repeat-associated protein